MTAAEKYDLVVIGAGPGGYVAALRAAQLGKKVACVEKDSRPGGTCLLVGCIPSKALLDSSEAYHQAQTRFAEQGVRVGGLEIDLETMMTRKERIVQGLSDNVRKLLEGSGIRVYRGTASLRSGTQVEVREGGGDSDAVPPVFFEASSILLATGSEPVAVPGLPFDGRRIVTSTEALSFDVIPERLGIVGGGYIGLELGSVWQRLGSSVTVIEMLPMVASTLDRQVGRALERSLVRQGLSIRLGTRVVESEVADETVSVTVDGGGGTERLEFDRLMVAVGRKPLTRGLNLQPVGIELHPQSGRIVVDEQYRTSVPTVYAIGDLIDGPMLAHKASAEGIAAVDCMAGLPGEVNYDAIPAIVYTAPEVASVGHTEERLKDLAVPYRVGTYPFSGVARARCLGETEGFVKILCHDRSGRVLGVHIIGPRASELIAEATVAVEAGLNVSQWSRTVHGHPTLSEAIHEAASALGVGKGSA